MVRSYTPEDYLPHGELSRWVAITTWLYIAMMLLNLMALLAASLILGDSAYTHEPGTQPESALSIGVALATQITDWITQIAYLFAGIVFLVWCHRIVTNLLALGDNSVRTSPTMAWVWWLIPIAWWFVPYLMIRRVVRASTPEADGVYSVEHTLADAVKWWILDLLQPVFYMIVFTVTMAYMLGNIASDPDSLMNRFVSYGFIMLLLQSGVILILEVLACLYCLRVIASISIRLQQQAERVLDWY
ncbi:MAG: DUF4328 domain-containing protein [Phycisphaeraceae bacterium]